MRYSKEDALMTRGLAITCMVVLHLFCKLGDDIAGTPLIWLNDRVPLVFLFGFFAEICVPLYSICAGYAQQLLWEKGERSFRARGVRILRLMKNYWIVLVLFNILGLIFDPHGPMPGSLADFLKSLILLHTYNGAWWYLNTYILLLLLPPALLLLPVRKMKPVWGAVFCLAIHVSWYLAERLALFPVIPETKPVLNFVWTEIRNFVGILAYVWAGGFLCKSGAVQKLGVWFEARIAPRWRKFVLLFFAIALFLGANIVHKWVAMGPVAVAVFLLFNIWRKSAVTQKFFLFLGRHSTNIWLTHMFFYAYLFVGLVFYAKYPVLVFVFMMALCIGSSYVIMLVNDGLDRICRKISAKRQMESEGSYHEN